MTHHMQYLLNVELHVHKFNLIFQSLNAYKGWIFIGIIFIFSLSYNFVRFFELVVEVGDPLKVSFFHQHHQHHHNPTFPFIATSTVCHKQNKKVNANNELRREVGPSPSTKGQNHHDH